MDLLAFRSRSARCNALYTRREQLRARAEQIRARTRRPWSSDLHFLFGQTYRDPKFYIIFRIFHAGNSAVFSPRNASLLHELSVRWQSMKYGHMLRDDTFLRYIGHLETHLA